MCVYETYYSVLRIVFGLLKQSKSKYSKKTFNWFPYKKYRTFSERNCTLNALTLIQIKTNKLFTIYKHFLSFFN